MAQVPTLALMNGVRIPQLGFGTYKLGENAQRIVESALEVGYRHLDGAQMYLNEAEVGRAIRSSGLPRDQLFLTSKLDNPNHNPDAAKWSLDKTLSDLGTDHLDLFLIHWPLPMYYGGDLGRTWRAMEDFYEQGLARSIGVSNFESHHLELVEQTASVAPMVNQVESHPYFPNSALHRFDQSLGIVTEAWSPLGRGRAASDPLLAAIGKEHGKSAAQVAVRWGLQRGDVLFPKSSTREGQMENLDVFDFSLTPSQMTAISSLSEGEAGRTGMHPDTMERLLPFEPRP
mgnify:FL=1